MKEQKTDKIIYIASTGGIKLESDKNKWVNAVSDMAKNMVLRQKDELMNKEVIITVEDNKYFSVALKSEKIGEPLSVVKEDFDVASSLDIEQKKPIIECKSTLKSSIDKKYLISLQGKEFITHEGLLIMAHAKGLKGIETELVQNDKEMYIFKAVAIGSNGERFSGYGDANKLNVNSMIAKHMLRMAETRAVNRSLRLFTGVGMCSADELGGD